MKKQGRNKGKKYAKPLSLYPMKFEEAVATLLNVKPAKSTNSAKGKAARNKHIAS